MKDKKSASGLKSAFDLALERMGQAGTDSASLSEAQKKALAEVDSSVQAKIAEKEIMMGQTLAAARAQGDAEKIAVLEQEQRDEIARVRRRGEEEKEQIRADR